MRELTARVASDLQLSQAERDQLTPGGGATTIATRVGWAKTYLKKAGLLGQPKWAHVQITKRGLEFLDQKPKIIDAESLLIFSEFQKFVGRTKPNETSTSQFGIIGQDENTSDASVTAVSVESINTPDEQITSASLALNETLRDALLARILESTPSFFEKVIVDLLLAMGYGGSRSDAGKQLGGTNDGGVDGLVMEDQLGLDRIYLQAKRYQPGNAVGGPTVQAFIGALINKGAQKGVLITTSAFSKSATDAARRSGQLRLVLIDGEELMKLMVRFGVGVRVARTIDIKAIDIDYFEGAEPE